MIKRWNCKKKLITSLVRTHQVLGKILSSLSSLKLLMSSTASITRTPPKSQLKSKREFTNSTFLVLGVTTGSLRSGSLKMIKTK